MTRILIADDHPVVLEGLVALLAGWGLDVVGRCRSGSEVWEHLERGAPDVLLLDVNMPPPGGLSILAELKGSGHPAKIVLLTSNLSDGGLVDAVRLGADGIVLKESAIQQLRQCLATIDDGGRWFDAETTRRIAAASSQARAFERPLTARELAVVRQVALGRRNKEIARNLDITEGTVKIYLHTIYEKLSVASRVELANVARKNGLLED